MTQPHPRLRKLILDALRAGISTAIPGAHDLSEDPEALSDDALPTFAVAMVQTDAEPVGMGAEQPLLVTDEVSVSIWDQGGTGIRTLLSDHANRIDGQIATGIGVVSPMVQDVIRTGHDFDVARGERRIGRMDLTFTAIYVAPLAGPDPDGFGSGFSGGFRKS